MHNYKTVAKYTRTEKIIEKSRFITSVKPCENREEAEAFFAEIRNEFKDATHNVPAFVLGEKMELKWMSDDGEPSGTAGPPILRFLEMNELTNLAVVVTRYFGGTKLGTGGLVRAYTSCVEEAIEQAGVAIAEEYINISVEFEYNAYNKFISQLGKSGLSEKVLTVSTDFAETVSLKLAYPEDMDALIKASIGDVSNGQAIVVEGEKTVQNVHL